MTLNQAPIPPLNALWRPNADSDVEDRELIRSYLGWPVTQYNLLQITAAMNRAAAFPATVTRIQGWIDESEDLELTYADQVSDGTAHLGNVQRYKGVRPGVELTEDDRQKKLDVIEWDTNLLAVEYEAGNRPEATAAGTISARIALLRNRIIQTLGLEAFGQNSGTMLLRS